MAFNVNQFRTHFTGQGEFAKTDKFEVWISTPNSLSGDPVFGSNMTKELSFQCEAAELPGKNISMVEYRHYAFTNRIPHHLQFPEVTLTFYCNGTMKEKKFFDAWIESMIPTQSGLINYYSSEAGTPNYATDVTIKQYSHIGTDAPSEPVDPNSIEEVMVTASKIKPRNAFGQRLLDSVVNKSINTLVDKYMGPIAQFNQYINPDGQVTQQPLAKDVTPQLIYDCKLIEAIPISVSSLPLNWSDDSVHRLQVTFAYKKWISQSAGITDNYSNEAVSNYTNDSENKDNRLAGVLEQTAYNAAQKFINKKLKL